MGVQDTVVEEDIWNQILSESTSKVNANVIESHSVVVLGDRNCGKSSLLARVQKEDADVNKGVALTYSFADMYESDNEDPTGRIDFWQLEGEVAHKELLQFGLHEKTVPGALVIIALDFSQPWTMVESLKRWLGVLQAHLEGIYSRMVSPSKTSLQERLQATFQSYREPTPTGNAVVKKKKTRIADLSVFPALDKNVLSTNLGIPVIVACCKCDFVSSLEKDYDYNDGMFEYIQQYLRRVCLNYGASLIYTSARKDTNCDLVREYIEHTLFGFDFLTRCQLLEKESIFVPMGWDSMPKIALDFENQKVCKDADEPFENVIKKPNVIKRREQTHTTLLAADDDQEFLQKQKSKLDTETDKKEEPSEKGSKIMEMLGGFIAPAPAPVAPDTADDEEDKPKPPSKKPGEAKPPAPAPAAGKAAVEKQALTDFFTSLMSKKAAPRNPAQERENEINKLRASVKK